MQDYRCANNNITEHFCSASQKNCLLIFIIIFFGLILVRSFIDRFLQEFGELVLCFQIAGIVLLKCHNFLESGRNFVLFALKLFLKRGDVFFVVGICLFLEGDFVPEHGLMWWAKFFESRFEGHKVFT